MKIFPKGDAFVRMYEMIFGKYGWIRVGESWLYKWSIQFQVSIEDLFHFFEGEFSTTE